METRTDGTVDRDRSIDALRGLLVVALVFVEYLPPSPEHAWLRHSPWDGVRVADFVFPGFLFVVGASMAVGRTPSWWRAARRVLALVALGLVFNAVTDVSPLRFTGVLQTIGIAGFLAAVVVRFARRWDDVALAVGALLVVHGLVVGRAFDVDRWVFADARLYRAGTAGHDPEGVLATVLGGTALVLLGYVATRVRSWWFVLAVAAVSAAAWVAWEPNKRAWTPTFTLVMAAAFALALLALRGVRIPLLDRVGRNALLVYVGQHVVRELVGNGPDSHLVLYAATAALAWTIAAVVLGRLKIRLVL